MKKSLNLLFVAAFNKNYQVFSQKIESLLMLTIFFKKKFLNIYSNLFKGADAELNQIRSYIYSIAFCQTSECIKYTFNIK